EIEHRRSERGLAAVHVAVVGSARGRALAGEVASRAGAGGVIDFGLDGARGRRAGAPFGAFGRRLPAADPLARGGAHGLDRGYVAFGRALRRPDAAPHATLPLRARSERAHVVI